MSHTKAETCVEIINKTTLIYDFTNPIRHCVDTADKLKMFGFIATFVYEQ